MPSTCLRPQALRLPGLALLLRVGLGPGRETGDETCSERRRPPSLRAASCDACPDAGWAVVLNVYHKTCYRLRLGAYVIAGQSSVVQDCEDCRGRRLSAQWRAFRV